ncbi:hypothetical protein [Nostoc sp. 'Peltigera malacea cyanobiont' DB3992]|nr:hypothetical protein [Nostoc sp. 'Peltigera malacea cyanobiont' DB3992]
MNHCNTLLRRRKAACRQTSHLLANDITQTSVMRSRFMTHI